MLCCYRVEKRDIIFDLKFGDVVLMKFMNSIMKDGKKLVVECIVYGVLDCVEDKVKIDFVELFYQVLENVSFVIEVCFCCVGGVMYQVFVEVCIECKKVFVICWLIVVVCGCNENIMVECLFGELMDVVNNCGFVVKKCEDIYWMVEVNCVFFYYCW